ncbi:hypothetical protein K7432_012343 [Basidiobolus ranarum]|uniref:Uncharacterized protein n=1 Tax=Basidiobolus ranarum TaxID=34480 RepID=A0ABR2VSI0_9FUNG
MVEFRHRKSKMQAEESIPFVSLDSKDSEVSSFLLNFSELPKWLKDNNYILTGYRSPTFSYRKCAESLLYIHNQTGNIYSHLLGAALFFGIAIFTRVHVLSQFETTHWSDIAVMYIFMFGAISCLCFSTLFHTFICHSERVSVNWNRCDYVGIVFLIVGSYFPAVNYAFYCSNKWKMVYLSFIVIFGTATAIMSIARRFGTPEYRWIRTNLFLAMGLSGICPLGHALWINGVSRALEYPRY